MEFVRHIFVLLVTLTFITYSSACMGYKVQITKLETCAGSIGKIEPDATATLTNDCKVILKGCGETVGFSTAKMTYTVKKDGNRILSGTMDACDQITKDKNGIAETLVKFGMPSKCPVEKMNMCVDGSQAIDISKHKSFLSLAKGTIQVKLDGEHDTGKSCFDIELKISK